MAEKEQKFRHQISSDTIQKTLMERSKGQSFGLIIGCLALMVAAYALYLSHPVAAGVIGGGTLTVMVIAFITGKKPDANQENKFKRI